MLSYSIFFFAVYSAVVSYAIVYHRQDIKLGMRSLVRSFRGGNNRNDFQDIHSRLMGSYREAPEWWYLILNVCT